MAGSAPFHFSRPKLATSLADALEGSTPFSAGGTLVLAGPRRTGKSTFLRRDLVPELENRNILPIYVDLWSNQKEDPARLIADAIKATFKAAAGMPEKLARKVGLSKLGGSWASIDVDKIGAVDGTTLTDALQALLERTGKRICLIVDEAQHALTTEAGTTTMFALKAARDALNQRDDAHDGPNLMLVLTGSHRDKLAQLVNKRTQPFFGLQVTPFPLLDRSFTNAYADWLNERLAEGNRFDKDDVAIAFELIGRRPEFLVDLLKDVALGEHAADRLGALLRGNAEIVRKRIWDTHRQTWESLTPTQQAVLGRLAEEGDGFQPFAKDALDAYSKAMGEEVTAASAQSALSALREKGIVWQSARGAYALEEADFAAWYETMKEGQG